ncbi:MAG: DUF433 domain-containing protein [Cyanobacteriota bacterium]|nr:DUF433 domain-containing protein [Cyanobacteriota bacterium]
MKLEDYFDFLAADDIRLKGTRVGIETILYEYIYRHRSPEAIFETYNHLTLEHIYATVLYFLHNSEDVTQYMLNWLNYCKNSEREQNENPPDYIVKLRELKAKQEPVYLQ